MHVADFSRGIMGANGIVAGGIALAAGAALAAQLERDGRVAVAFFGDGAANQGVLMEALNVGALWKLPLILACENNGFSEFSPTATVTAGRIAERATPLGVPGQVVDGNDIAAVWQAAGTAIDRARQGQGPTLLEFQTYRLRGHMEQETAFLDRPYRMNEEVEAGKRNDPLVRCRAALLSDEPALLEELAALEKDVEREVALAKAAAKAAAWPDPRSVGEGMFA
jgi:pyruvate dehydrogenase E1 component alpha subunit